MASIKKYATKQGTKWRVQYRSPDGKSRTKRGFETKAKAQAWADKNAVSIGEGSWVDPAGAKITISDLAETWLATRSHLKPSTKAMYKQVWEGTVKPHWGDYRVASIRPSMVQTWVSGSAHSASWTRHAHNVLSQILQIAVEDNLIARNPARGVKLPRRSKGVNVYLTMEQLKTLATKCGDREDLVLLLGTVGLRWGEAIALRPMDIDFTTGRIAISRNAAKTGNTITLGTPKTHKTRSVAISRFVLDKLAVRAQGKASDALLWTNTKGGFLMAPGHNSWFYSAVEKCQKEDDTFPRVTVHGLRHVAAGLLVQAGANVKLVSAQLGHASTSETLNRYAGLFDDGLDEIADVMDRELSGGRHLRAV